MLEWRLWGTMWLHSPLTGSAGGGSECRYVGGGVHSLFDTTLLVQCLQAIECLACFILLLLPARNGAPSQAGWK